MLCVCCDSAPKMREFLVEMLATLDDIDDHRRMSLNEFIELSGFTARASELINDKETD